MHWHLLAVGRVQGVNYRARVADSACRLGISGTVENRHDGTVFIDAQGPPERMELFVLDVSGPRGASHPTAVRRLGEVPVVPDLVGFAILRE